MFGHDWERCEARVVDYSDRRDGLTGGWKCDYAVDVQPTDGPAFRAVISHRSGGVHGQGDFAAPSKGDVVGVLVDTSSQKVKFDSDDPRLSQRGGRRAEEDASEERLRSVAEEPPGTQADAEGSGRRVIRPG